MCWSRAFRVRVRLRLGIIFEGIHTKVLGKQFWPNALGFGAWCLKRSQDGFFGSQSKLHNKRPNFFEFIGPLCKISQRLYKIQEPKYMSPVHERTTQSEKTNLPVHIDLIGEIWVNFGLGNRKLSEITKPIPETIFTYDQWWYAFIWE